VAGKIRNMVNRSGRYHARLVVPKGLRDIIGKTEIREALGGDYRQALKLLPSAVTRLQHQIAHAEQTMPQGCNNPSFPRYPLAPDQIAYSHYMQRLNIDDIMRNDTRWAAIGINDLYVNRLREGMAGLLDDEELIELMGAELERFRALGNIDAEQGSDEWRIIARALCSAEYEALERVAERDEGDFTGKPTNPLIVNAQPPKEPRQKVKLSKLWDDYVAGRIQAGFMRDGGKRQRPVICNLIAFIGYDDARRITKKDLLAWRDHLMNSLSRVFRIPCHGFSLNVEHVV